MLGVHPQQEIVHRLAELAGADVEVDLAAKAIIALQVGHVVAELDALCLERFGLAGNAGFFHCVDIHADDFVDVGVIHAGLDFGRQTGLLLQQWR